MKKNNIIKSLFAILIVSILGVGAIFAHGGSFSNNRYSNMGYGMNQGMMNFEYMNEMHNHMIDIYNEGTYEDLEKFREEYNMPAMYWIENEKDLENFKNNGFNMGYGNSGYGMMR